MSKYIYLDLVKECMDTLVNNLLSNFELMNSELNRLENVILENEDKITDLIIENQRLQTELNEFRDDSRRVQREDGINTINKIDEPFVVDVGNELNNKCVTCGYKTDKCNVEVCPSPIKCCVKQAENRYHFNYEYCGSCNYNGIKSCPDIPECPEECCCYGIENKLNLEGETNETE